MHVYAPAPSIERVIAKIHATILNCRNSMRRVLRRPCHTVRFLDCARNDRVGKSTVRRLLSFRLFAFCHFDRSIVFSLAFAQNRGFCAKEERQRSEVARRVYAACLERSLPRRARGEIQFAATSAWRNPARSADKRWRLDSSTSSPFENSVLVLAKGSLYNGKSQPPQGKTCR